MPTRLTQESEDAGVRGRDDLRGQGLDDGVDGADLEPLQRLPKEELIQINEADYV
jgi:hypothetical protein